MSNCYRYWLPRVTYATFYPILKYGWGWLCT